MRQLSKLHTLFLLLFFALVWHAQNQPYIAAYRARAPVSEDKFIELLYYMNSSASGYSSIQNYCLVYLIPFLLLLQQLFKNEKSHEVIRHRGREKLFLLRFREIAFAAMIIGAVHSLVNVGASFLTFETSLVLSSDLLMYSLMNGLSLSLFYSVVGLIYSIQRDWFLSEGAPLVGTLLLIGGLFFFTKLLMPNAWTPLKDLILLTRFFEQVITWHGVAWIYAKQTILGIILFLFASSVAGRKDYIK